MTTIIYKEGKFYADRRVTNTLSDPHKCAHCGGKHVVADTQEKIYHRGFKDYKYLDYPLYAMAAAGDTALINLINHMVRRRDGSSFIHMLTAMADAGVGGNLGAASIMLLTDQTLFCYEISGTIVQKSEHHKIADMGDKFVATGSGAPLATFGIQIMGLNPVEAIQFASLGDKFTGSGVTEVEIRAGEHHNGVVEHDELQLHELTAKFLYDKKLLSDKIISLPPTFEITNHTIQGNSSQAVS